MKRMFSKNNFLKAAAFAGISFMAASCSQEGCTDPTAINYDSDAKQSDGSCEYENNKTYTIVPFTLNGVNYRQISGSINEDLTLCDDENWLLNGGVFVNEGAILTICAGTEIWATPDGDTEFLSIAQGAKINAEGTAIAPIVFSAFDQEPGSWGGLILNGYATLNNGLTAEGECGSGIYGGTNDSDNSGVLKYVRVEYAGLICATDDELNGISFNGVGSGTVVEHVQAYRGADDGFEFFGGTVSVRWAVSTGNHDDSFDWTQGWRGNGQFWVVEQNTDGGDRGIEADNNGDDNSASPFSNPTLSNITIVNADDGDGENTGMRLREGTKGLIRNAIVANSPANGVRVSDQVTTDNMDNGDLTVASTIVFGAGTPWKECAPFENDATNSTDDPGLTGFIGTVSTNATDPTKLGEWFQAGSYIGAVPVNENWTATGNWVKAL